MPKNIFYKTVNSFKTCINTAFPVDFDSPKNVYSKTLYVPGHTTLSSFGAKPLSSATRFWLSKLRPKQPNNIRYRLRNNLSCGLSGSPVFLSDIATDVATSRINIGFPQHLHCRIQKRPWKFGGKFRTLRVTVSFIFCFRFATGLIRSQAKGFAPNEDKLFAPKI